MNATKTYQQMLEEAAQRAAELDAHVVTSEELDRLERGARAIITGDGAVKNHRTYAVGGYFRAADGAVLSQTVARNVQPSEVRRVLVSQAMREDAVKVEYWPEAF